MPAATYPDQWEDTMMPAIYRYVVTSLGGPATIVLPLSSAVGVTVPAGSEIVHDGSGQTWILSDDVDVPALGTEDGVFTADGPASVSISDTFSIVSVVADWDSVGPSTSEVSFDWTVFFSWMDGADRRAPAPPTKPFAVIRILDLPQDEGRQWAQAYDSGPTTLGMVVRNIGMIRTEIQIFSDTEQRVAAERLRKNLDLQYPQIDRLTTAGMASIPGETRMRDLSQVFSGETEFRYLLEIGLRVETRFEVTEDYPYISEVRPLTVDVT